MPDLFDNPMGLMGFEFLEFAAPTPDTAHKLEDAILTRARELRLATLNPRA